MLGTDELHDYLDKYKIKLDKQFKSVLGRHQKKSWTKYVNEGNKHLANLDAIDLLSKLLVYDHVNLQCESELSNTGTRLNV